MALGFKGINVAADGVQAVSLLVRSPRGFRGINACPPMAGAQAVSPWLRGINAYPLMAEAQAVSPCCVSASPLAEGV